MFSQVSIDQVHDFWNRQPCNVRHSSQDQSTVEYFDECAKKRYTVEPHIPVFADFTAWSGKNVLELGSGIGTDAVQFAKHGANVTCCELSPRSLDLCRTNFAVHGLNGEFYQGNLEDMLKWLPIKKYDLIYSFGVVHHTPNPDRVIKSIKSYCDQNTIVKMMLYNRFSYKLFRILRETNQWDFSNLDATIAKYSEAQTGCPVTYTYTKDDVRELLKDYQIISIEKDHIFPYYIPDYKKNILTLENHFQNMDQADFNKMKKDLGWHLLITFKL